MQKVKLLYNPISGNTTFPKKLDIIIATFQAAGYQVVPYRSMHSGAIARGVCDSDMTYAFFLIAGGDGTIHEVINAMLKNRVDRPLGILPTGTSNDFARCLHMPPDIEECCHIILQQHIRRVDVGKVNEDYFINVASGGFLTDVSQKTDVRFKNMIGKLSYYLKVLSQLTSIRSFKLSFICDYTQFEEEILLFLVFNGNSINGIDKWSEQSSIYDGYVDVLVFRACRLPQIISLFIKILRGEHLNDPHVIYFQTNNLQISLLDHVECPTDLDGEKSPACPLHITVLPRKIRLFTRK